MYLVRTFQQPDVPEWVPADFYEFEGDRFIAFYKVVNSRSWTDYTLPTKLVKLFNKEDINTVEEV